MSVLQPTVPVPKTVVENKKFDLEVATDSIHEFDQIEFHRQSS